MKISIITVCFNAQRTIAETITSVCSQNYHDLEYLVVDGSSTDRTAEIIRTHPQFNRITTFISEPDEGIYDAMNKGISMASGEVVGLLNADDVYLDSTVLDQVASVFEDQSIDACYADLVYVKQFDATKIIRYWKSNNYLPGLFERGWMPAHPTFFVRKNVYEKYGVFDLIYPNQADFELTMRFLRIHQIRTRYIPKLWVRMRLGGASNRSILKTICANLEAFRACKKHRLAVSVAPWFIFKKIASRIPQFFRRPG